MQHVTALELATYFNGTTDEADLTDEWIAQADLLLQMIAADVEAAAGVPFEFETGTRLLPGTWSRDLELPAGPIQSVSALSVNGSSLAASSFYWNDRHIIRRGVNAFDDGDVFADYPENAQGAHTRTGLHWSGPQATVRVTYAWGFEIIPDWIKSLELRIAGRTFGNVSNVTQESLAIYSVTYGGGRTGESGSHVTDAERKRLRHLLNRTGGTIQAAGR